MATNTLKTRIVLCNDTSVNWGSSDKVLLKGEMAIEIPESGAPKIKFGDGTNTFAKLQYATMTPDEIAEAISTAVSSANHSHSNKAILDAITASFTTQLKDNYDKAYTHSTTAHAPSNAERNTIVGIQKNGTDITPDSNRKVNIAVPTKLSELTNDVGYKTTDTVYTHPNSGVTAGTYRSVTVNAQGHVTGGTNPTTLSGYGITDAYTKTATDSAIATAVANAGHLKRTIVSALPSVDSADENTIYMVAKTSGDTGSATDNGYNEYMLVVSGNTKKFEKIGDSAVNLTDYATKTYAESAASTAVSNAAGNYATKAQGGKADTAVQSVKIGTKEYKSGTTVTLPAYPTTLPASDVSAWAKATTKPTYTKSEVGLGNVDNTADANKSVKYATSAGSASSATTASKLGSNAGSTTQPVYFSNGVPVACNVSTDCLTEGTDTLILNCGGAA